MCLFAVLFLCQASSVRAALLSCAYVRCRDAPRVRSFCRSIAHWRLGQWWRPLGTRQRSAPAARLQQTEHKYSTAHRVQRSQPRRRCDTHATQRSYYALTLATPPLLLHWSARCDSAPTVVTARPRLPIPPGSAAPHSATRTRCSAPHFVVTAMSHRHRRNSSVADVLRAYDDAEAEEEAQRQKNGEGAHKSQWSQGATGKHNAESE